MLLSCFDPRRPHLFGPLYVLTGAMLVLASCAPQSPVPFEPTRLVPFDPVSAAADDDFGEGSGRLNKLIEEAYLGGQRRELSACEVLARAPTPRVFEPRFQVLNEFSLRTSAEGRRTRLRLDGRVALANNPLYQLAILEVEIPDRAEFLRLMDEEIRSYTIVAHPLLRLGELLFKMNIADVYKKRNEIIQERLSAAFPGMFDPAVNLHPMDLSLPDALLRNALTDAAARRVESAEANAQRKAVSGLARAPLRVFHADNWDEFGPRFREANIAWRDGLVSDDPQENVCAATLAHWNFSQLLEILGQERLPVQYLPDDRSYVPQFSDLLESYDQQDYLVCRQPGMFVESGHRKFVGAAELEEFSSKTHRWDLSSKLFLYEDCYPSRAKPRSSFGNTTEREHSVQSAAGDQANLEDWLELLHSLSHWIATVSPGSQTWRASTRPYPLIPFDGINAIRSSGGVLPLQAHAAALAMINVSVTALEKKHLVLLDSVGRETTDQQAAAALRLSLEPRNPGSNTTAVTTLKSVVRLTEALLLMRAGLEQTAGWIEAAEREQAIFEAEEPDPLLVSQHRADFDRFINGLFGNRKNLDELTESRAGSVRDKVDQLTLASAMLLMKFQKQCAKQIRSTPTVESPRFVEQFEGTCDATDQHHIDRVAALVGRAFRAPIFFRGGE